MGSKQSLRKCALSNRMGLVSLTIMTASNMMGSGVFMLPGSLANIGSISVIGSIIAAFGIFLLAIIFTKINEVSPCKGGVIANIESVFGPFLGLQTSFFYWISSWLGNCALLVTGVGYLSFFFPILNPPLNSAIACIIILWLFVLFGLQGARIVGFAQIFTGLCMLIVVLSIGFFSWKHFNSNTYIEAWNVSGKSDTSAILIATLFSMWGYLGIESASVSSAQVKNPKRNIPLATLIGLLIAATCYLSSTNAVMGILEHKQLIISSSPFADTARLIWGSDMGKLLSAMAVIACLGAMPGWQILQTEVPRAAAEKGILPAFFAVTNKHNVAYKGLIFTATLMSFVILLTISPNLEKQFRILITFAISACLIPYIFTVLSLPILMVRQGIKHKFYHYMVICAIGLVFIGAALFNSGLNIILAGIALQIIILPLYFLFLSKQKKSLILFKSTDSTNN